MRQAQVAHGAGTSNLRIIARLEYRNAQFDAAVKRGTIVGEFAGKQIGNPAGQIFVAAHRIELRHQCASCEENARLAGFCIQLRSQQSGAVRVRKILGLGQRVGQCCKRRERRNGSGRLPADCTKIISADIQLFRRRQYACLRSSQPCLGKTFIGQRRFLKLQLARCGAQLFADRVALHLRILLHLTVEMDIGSRGEQTQEYVRHGRSQNRFGRCQFGFCNLDGIVRAVAVVNAQTGLDRGLTGDKLGIARPAVFHVELALLDYTIGFDCGHVARLGSVQPRHRNPHLLTLVGNVGIGFSDIARKRRHRAGRHSGEDVRLG